MQEKTLIVFQKKLAELYNSSDKEFVELSGDYQAKRAKPTRNLDFRKLIGLGLIVKVGKGKATYYKFK